MTLRHRLMHHSYRLLVKWARYLHVYLTLFGFALLLFFAVTGFMLNHEDMFLQQKQEGVVPVELLASPEDAKDSIVSKLREEFGIEGDLETFDVVKDINEIRAVFKTPEASISATIQQGDGKTKVQREKELITKGNLPMDLLEPWDKGKELLIVEKLRLRLFRPRQDDPVREVKGERVDPRGIQGPRRIPGDGHDSREGRRPHRHAKDHGPDGPVHGFAPRQG